MKRQTTILAAVLTVTSVVISSSAAIQAETVEVFRIPLLDSQTDRSFTGSDTTIVILSATGEMQLIPNPCGVAGGSRPLYNAVVIGGSGWRSGLAGAIPVQVAMEKHFPPGTRLKNAFSDNLECCLTENNIAVHCAVPDARFAVWVTSLEVVARGHSSPLLLASTAEVSAEDVGVITGRQDEAGFAEVVFTRKGSKPTFAPLLSDQRLEPADQIVDVIEIDYDPATGIALYGGFLEY